MKVCSKCKQEKPYSEFHKNKTRGDGYQYHCKSCKTKGNSSYIENNKENYNKYHKDRYENNYEFFNDYKSNLQCLKCGEKRYWVLDFHHLNPKEKESQVSQLVMSSRKKLLEEISKCVPLCRNCHTDFHYKEKQENLLIEDYLKSI